MMIWYNLLVIFFTYFTAICIATKAKTLNNYIYAGIISAVTGLFFSVIAMLIWLTLGVHSMAQHASGTVAPFDMLINKANTNAVFLLPLWILAGLIMTTITLWIPVIAYSHVYKKRIIWGILIANIIILSTGFLLYNR